MLFERNSANFKQTHPTAWVQKLPGTVSCVALAAIALTFAAEALATERPVPPRNWLERLFPSIDHCTPVAPFHYEAATGRSVPGTLEALGYKARQIRHDVTHYDVKERFFGMRATEILVPNHMGVISVSLDASVEEASSRLKRAFGETISVFPNNADEPGVAYLYARDPAHSAFVCDSEPN